MKRKIVAIVAADIAGYSRLIAEDEEDTLRRLRGHRTVYDGLVVQYGGRIFNAAGDAVLSEFPSSVDAVRCAIEIQESLRRLNKAYPPSRHMNFRIGIFVGDVVERDGDLLGDGVNVAARLEGLAEPGGICIARNVHEQVAAKLTAQFTDIGPQLLKNIPIPMHAYTLNLAGNEPDLQQAAALGRELVSKQHSLNRLRFAAAVALLVIAGAGGIFIAMTGNQPATEASTEVMPDDLPAPGLPDVQQLAAVNTIFDPANVPFIGAGERNQLQWIYVPAPDHKALALSHFGHMGISTAQATDAEAQAAALATCRANAGGRTCSLHAVGLRMVNTTGAPPMPPTPWRATDESLYRPFDSSLLPFITQTSKDSLSESYLKHSSPKAIAFSATGNYQIYSRQGSTDEAARRTLESCGARSGTACRILVVDDKIVLPIPTEHKVLGFFDAWASPAIELSSRAIIGARIAIALKGWSAVAVGANSKPGLKTEASTEADAVAGAMAACAAVDNACKLLAIGQFMVEAK